MYKLCNHATVSNINAKCFIDYQTVLINEATSETVIIILRNV
jgi:hypothetical protein